MKNTEIWQSWRSRAFPLENKTRPLLVLITLPKLPEITCSRFQVVLASRTRAREIQVALHVGVVGMVFTETLEVVGREIECF